MAEYRMSGHRARVRERFLRYGREVFESYELLELLLFYSIPMKDTRALARELVDRFGSLSAVFSAERQELLSVSGVGESTAQLILLTAELLAAAREDDSGTSSPPMDYISLGKMLCGYFDNVTESISAVVSLDNSLRLIGIDVAYKLPFSSGATQPSEFLRLALERNAAVAVIAYNHPSGSAFPFPAELETARLVSQSFARAGIPLAEQYSVGGADFVGIMEHISDAFREHSSVAGFGRKDTSCHEPSAGRSCDAPARHLGLFTSIFSYLGGDFSSVANSLCSAYAGTCAVLNADFSQLRRLNLGEKPELMLRLLTALFSATYTEAIAVGRVCRTEQIEKYLTGLFFGKSYEELYMLSFDGKMRYIDTDKISEGAASDIRLVPRRILEKAFRRGARSVVLAHSHPSGDTVPSAEDIESTRQFRRMLEDYGAELLCHYIVADGKVGAVDWLLS